MLATTPNPGLYQSLLADLRRLKVQKSGMFFILFYAFRHSGFQATLLYRLAAGCVHKGKIGKATSIILERVNSTLNSCDISPEAVIGPGLFLSHPVGIVIGKATIGSNVSILQNTTIGLRKPTDDEHDSANYPTIGNDVAISAGAALLGGITVGHGVWIGANAVVLKDVPDGCTAVGVPARIMEKKIEPVL